MKKRKRFSAPLSVELSITNKCNLNCLHCINESGRISRDELTTAEIKNVVDQLAALNLFYLSYGGGEPLLHNDFFELFEYACSKKNLKIGLATNGTLVDAKVAARLKKAGVYLVRVSLDGHDKASHDAFRRADCFDRTIAGIRHLLDHKISTTVITVISRHNIENFEKIVQKCVNIGVSAINAITFVPEGRGKDAADLALSPLEYKQFLKRVIKLKKRSDIRILTETPLLSILDHSTGCATCLAGRFMILINENGDVTPCSYFKNVIGNVRLDAISTIWQKSKLLDALCDPALLAAACRNCKYSEICFGGCRAGACNTSGTISASDPLCWLKQKKTAKKQ